MAELALPYVPIDPGIEESERMDAFLDAVDLHDDPNGPWRVIRLLLWAGKERPDGNIGRVSDHKLARVCRWDRDPAELRAALLESGWLIEVESGYRVEGWERHGGKVLKKRENWRSQKQRGRKSGGCPAEGDEKSGGHPPEGGRSPSHVRPLKGEG